MSLKLFGGEIIFEEFQPMWSRFGLVWFGKCYRRTDRQTDRQTTCHLNRTRRSIAR